MSFTIGTCTKTSTWYCPLQTGCLVRYSYALPLPSRRYAGLQCLTFNQRTKRKYCTKCYNNDDDSYSREFPLDFFISQFYLRATYISSAKAMRDGKYSCGALRVAVNSGRSLRRRRRVSEQERKSLRPCSGDLIFAPQKRQ